MARPRVALVIPTLNEEAAIGGVLAGVPRGAVDDIIVVDSGSSDRTVERARAAGARVVSLRERGYGRACRAGAEAAITTLATTSSQNTAVVHTGLVTKATTSANGFGFIAKASPPPARSWISARDPRP